MTNFLDIKSFSIDELAEFIHNIYMAGVISSTLKDNVKTISLYDDFQNMESCKDWLLTTCDREFSKNDSDEPDNYCIGIPGYLLDEIITNKKHSIVVPGYHYVLYKKITLFDRDLPNRSVNKYIKNMYKYEEGIVPGNSLLEIGDEEIVE